MPSLLGPSSLLPSFATSSGLCGSGIVSGGAARESGEAHGRQREP